MISTEELINDCVLFQSVTPAEMEELLYYSETEEFSEGARILDEGNSTRYLWVIKSGSCEVRKKLANGSEQTLTKLSPLSVFGEMSFFKPAPHSASVVALSDVEVVRIPGREFDQMLKDGAKGAQKVVFNTVRIMSDRLRMMDKWSAEMAESCGSRTRNAEWHDFRSKLYSDWKF
ncbi:Crp/Fnr family transcriptional regulator [Gimesia maris]|mgnify:FL=1|uniref:cAMP receptor protein n=1 Tax=Gimesia maris TaxID=122 RepID=A0ABX5YIR4_9PLAN|nr:cyclic nucleotide-binding domain-containing protein [Gimesia maris]HAW27407.1 cyclic nucleotide-binding domain-containing protein [Planctomycetaceae bacterium]EDL56363.1 TRANSCRIPTIONAL REGULATOR, CRP/FNR FAMILY [Gimesia maris DSM 8797]QDT77858.1 cAMP receptor protein [Gimesia maris]QDU13520.1 cAMP receptor protein [Gimesia maris]QEG15448.1 cAMP receptor protein [Gimesia maris]|tara:strand:+ start:261068 stop:261592 length:525 start_codon:yes stop_codon:yes gene_type:complete